MKELPYQTVFPPLNLKAFLTRDFQRWRKSRQTSWNKSVLYFNFFVKFNQWQAYAKLSLSVVYLVFRFSKMLESKLGGFQVFHFYFIWLRIRLANLPVNVYLDRTLHLNTRKEGPCTLFIVLDVERLIPVDLFLFSWSFLSFSIRAAAKAIIFTFD